MKKILLFLMMLLIGQFTLLSQSVNWINPKPSGEDFYDIAFSDAQKGWMVGTHGAIFHTQDAGISWERINAFTDQIISQIVFINPNQIILKGESSLFVSYNGGESWTTLCDLGSTKFLKVEFPSSTKGYALLKDAAGVRSLALSTDGGINWNIVHQQVTWTDVAAKDENEVMVADSVHILKSTDGGINFIDVYTESQDRKWNNILYLNDNTWVAAGYTNYYNECRILRSSDGGFTWNLIDLNAELQVEHLKKNLSGMIFAYGLIKSEPPLNIIYSTDEGQNWNFDVVTGWIESGYSKNFRICAAWYKDVNHAFAYAWNGVLDAEPDFGRFNTLLEKNGNAFSTYKGNFCRSIFGLFWDDEEGIHANTQQLLRSNDNGETWLPFYTSAFGRINKFAKITETSHYFVLSEFSIGDKGLGSEILTNIQYSSDHGNTWETINQNMNISTSGFQVFATHDAYLFGRRTYIEWKKDTEYSVKICGKAQLFLSRNMGRDWSEIALPLDTMANMHFVNADTGFIFGGGGSTPHGGYYMSSDKGNTWTYFSLGLPAIAFGRMLNSSLGLVVTQETPAKVYRFSTFSNQPDLIFVADSADFIADIGFTSPLQGYVLCKNGEDGKLYFTQNGGQTWNFSGVYPYLNHLKIFSNLNGFAYGTAGRLLKLQNGYPVGINQPELNWAKDFSIWPIPANEALWINIEANEICLPAKMEIWSQEGKKIWDQDINDTIELSHPIPTRTLAPGFYILKFTAKSSSFVRKFIVAHPN